MYSEETNENWENRQKHARQEEKGTFVHIFYTNKHYTTYKEDDIW